MSTTKTVRAYKYLKRGKPADVLQLDDRHQVPKPGDDELLIKVKAVGLNPVDWKIMNYLPSFIAKHPAIAGCDYSGTVLESSSADFAAGDEVFGIVHSTLKVSKGLGSLAEEIVAPTPSCAKRPEHVEAVPAAGLPLVGLTAIVLSREVEWALKKKEDAPKVLVSGGSSSVGLQLVPVLKHKGCFVAATCSAAKADMVKGRGADVTFDYKEGNLAEKLNSHVKEHGPFDMILDCADAFEVWKTAGKTLNKEGSYVNVGADLTQGVLPVLRRMISYYFRPSWLGGVPRSYKRPGEIASKRNMDELAELVDQNVITPVVDSEYSFEDTVAAYDRVMSNRAMGKVIVRVR